MDDLDWPFNAYFYLLVPATGPFHNETGHGEGSDTDNQSRNRRSAVTQPWLIRITEQQQQRH